MPCRSDGYEDVREIIKPNPKLNAQALVEIEAAHERVQGKLAEVDQLTHRMDELRELTLAVAAVRGAKSPALTRIRRLQKQHRQEDLDRLEAELGRRVKTARAAHTHERYVRELEAVRTASPHLPLFAQLGFDPDKY